MKYLFFLTLLTSSSTWAGVITCNLIGDGRVLTMTMDYEPEGTVMKFSEYPGWLRTTNFKMAYTGYVAGKKVQVGFSADQTAMVELVMNSGLPSGSGVLKAGQRLSPFMGMGKYIRYEAMCE